MIMSFTQWYGDKIKKLKWYDMPLLKLSLIAFGLLLAKLYAPLLSVEWHWYAAVFVIAAILPLYHVFRK